MNLENSISKLSKIKKRILKEIQKDELLTQQFEDESVRIKDSIDLLRKVMAHYQNNPNINIISEDRLDVVAKEFLIPYTPSYHSKKGILINKGHENRMFSIVCFDKNRLGKLKHNKKVQKPLWESHEFEYDKVEGVDVHKLWINAKGNIPIFLDRKERNYLKHHEKTLELKYKEMMRKQREMPKIPEVIYEQEPPKAHKNWIICFCVYNDYFEHIYGKDHIKNTNEYVFKDYYQKIDDISKEMKKEYEESKLKKTQNDLKIEYEATGLTNGGIDRNIPSSLNSNEESKTITISSWTPNKYVTDSEYYALSQESVDSISDSFKYVKECSSSFANNSNPRNSDSNVNCEEQKIEMCSESPTWDKFQILNIRQDSSENSFSGSIKNSSSVSGSECEWDFGPNQRNMNNFVILEESEIGPINKKFKTKEESSESSIQESVVVELTIVST